MVMEEPIRVKAELVKTREVIAKKFQQSQKERIKRERVIDETFTPPCIKLTSDEIEPVPESELDDKLDIVLNDDSEGVRKNKKIGGSGNMAAKRRMRLPKGARGKKFTKLEGKSFIPYNSNIVYEYYDDPNELCDRMRLLTSSKTAGNTNHNQEINSILEELYERGIIL